MTNVPIKIASSIFPPGKFPGACSSRNTAPNATFIPRVFIMSASQRETSLTKPVEFRTKLSPPPKSAGRELLCVMLTSIPRSGMEDPCLTTMSKCPYSLRGKPKISNIRVLTELSNAGRWGHLPMSSIGQNYEATPLYWDSSR